MKLVLALPLVLIVAVGVAALLPSDDVQHQVVHSRRRRRVDQMREMVRWKSGRNPAEFIGYGNFCGLGGSGVPADAIDACCQTHDFCFDNLVKATAAGNCSSSADGNFKFRVYWSEYKYGIIKPLGNISCSDDPAESRYYQCLRTLCECDKALALCLERHRDAYDSRQLRVLLAPLRLAFKLADRASTQDWFWSLVKKWLMEV